MQKPPEILCIGSVLWDVIGRSTQAMQAGSDVPGRVTRLPGGVAMNIAMTLRRFDLRPALLSVVGQDSEGIELIRKAEALDLNMNFLYRSEDLPTDQYLAIEGSNGMIAAVADAHSLEAVGDKILAPLENGLLGTAERPFEGLIALDGNLTLALLAQIAASPLFTKCDLRIAPASPGKAERLLPLLGHKGATLYVNVEEAELLCQQSFSDAQVAAQTLVARGSNRVLVTHGPKVAALADSQVCVLAAPPAVLPSRVTGAGDTFMAAHIAAELRGLRGVKALQSASNSAAAYVAGKSEG
jgi:pseudouridine kinase|tara:strand:- start:687 stop:1580 length:894 start_codon:yes stop_codon:yes gene_type:complete